MKKVFCNQCIYLSKESEVLFGEKYNKILFKDNSKTIQSSTDVCVAKKEIYREIFDNPIRKQIQITVLVNDPFELNAKNNCALYQEPLSIKIYNWIKNKLNNKKES